MVGVGAARFATQTTYYTSAGSSPQEGMDDGKARI